MSLIGAVWPAWDNYRGRVGARVERQEDLPYRDTGHPKNALDLFLPGTRTGPVPWVLFLHGGGWKPQDRKLLRPLSGLYGNVGVALAERGIATAIASYRQPDGQQSLEDLHAAMAWIHEHAASAGAPLTGLVVMGHSMGGHLACLLGQQDPRVMGIVSLGGAYDLERTASFLSPSDQRGLERVFPVASRDRLSPERRLTPETVPHLLLVAEHDPKGLQQEHASMVAACQARGTPVTALTVPGVGHMGLVLELGRPVDRVSGPVAEHVHRVTAR